MKLLHGYEKFPGCSMFLPGHSSGQPIHKDPPTPIELPLHLHSDPVKQGTPSIWVGVSLAQAPLGLYTIPCRTRAR